MIMAEKVFKVGGCKFILLRWGDKWVFPLISYYLSGKDSPIYMAFFSWNLKEGKFVKETTVTINFSKKPRGFCCQFVDTPKNGSSIIDWLVDNGFGLETKRSVTSGLSTYPEFYFVGGVNFHKYKRFCDDHPEISKFLRI